MTPRDDWIEVYTRFGPMVAPADPAWRVRRPYSPAERIVVCVHVYGHLMSRLGISLTLLIAACTGSTGGRDSTKESAADATDTGLADSETARVETADTRDSGETGDTVEPVACDRSLPWTFVDAGIQQTCGIHSDGCAECWGIGAEDDGPAWDTGAYHYQGEDVPPPVSFATVDMLRDRSNSAWSPHACGLTTDGEVVCWGNDDFGMSTPSSGSYAAVAVTASTTWAIRADGAVVAWGPGTSAPSLAELATAEGAYGVMVLSGSGQLTYWNEFGTYQFSAPTEPFTAFDFGHVFGCGINAMGDVHCWELWRPEAWESADLTVDAPPGPFVDLCVGWGASACALREDGSLSCWSEPYDPVDLSGVPEGHAYTQVACGWQHACAVTVDGLLLCWGNDTYGETLVPT